VQGPSGLIVEENAGGYGYDLKDFKFVGGNLHLELHVFT